MKQLLETLFFARHTLVLAQMFCWCTQVCSVTGEPYHCRSRRNSSFMDSSALLNIWEVSITKVKSFLLLAAKNLHWNIIKKNKTMEKELSYYTAFRNSFPDHKDRYWLTSILCITEHEKLPPRNYCQSFFEKT